ncbi:MAG TPA: carboxypeptidase-like regulatory domain-containing protein [Polyangiaceae bacterium]|jgi:hypothetical protein|nr:carboxypeptidase-like regulatory domain-containing protein [Polyangiaceae bacterium]
MVRARELLILAWAVGALALVSASGCGSKSNQAGPGDDDSGVSADGSVGDDGAGSSSGSSGGSSSGDMFVSPGADASAASACSGSGGLLCYVKAGCTTTLSGTVYDPAGENPLPNVVVFIPNDPAGSLPAIKQGTNTCNTCDVSIGDYVTATTSAADGTFTLTGVPATTHVPLVVQIGKWRREVFLSQTKSCTSNKIPGSSLTRLPAKRSEGDIPQMALVTGGADNLGCFLTGIGLDPTEYSAPHGGGRLDIYQGQGRGGGAPGLSTGGMAGDCSSDNANCVWNSKANLEAYDIVLLACEGDTFDPAESKNGNTNKTTTSKAALHDWLNEGGKVFATHYHYTWFKNGPADFQSVATWLGSSGGSDNGVYDIDTSFPKGVLFDQWLGTVGALTGTQITLSQVAESVGGVSKDAQRWIYNPGADMQGDKLTNNTKYLSFLTPIGGAPIVQDGGEMTEQYCGKAVFSDLHAGGSPTGAIPMACAGPPLSAQLKALEFLFFDLSACVSNDTLPMPMPPPPTK